MLPPGHIAAGYLTAEAFLHFTHSSLSAHQQTELVWWGLLVSILPDFDFIGSFIKYGGLKYDPRKGNHREFSSHAPILWLIAGLLIYFLAPTEFWKTFGILLWLCSWSHFVMDTIQYGIRWLWPFSNKRFRLNEVINEPSADNNIAAALNKNFFSYWWVFLKEYAKGLKISLICEAVLVVVTFILYFYHII